MVLKENTGMLKLGEKLGFQRKWLSREQVFELTLDLNRMEAFSVSL
jgi:RimJ/RimL family protein N-acetyltransferase